MTFVSIIVSPVMRSDCEYTRGDIFAIKVEMARAFAKYGATHITCHFHSTTDARDTYDDNYGIIEFTTEKTARDVLKAIEQGRVHIGGVKVTDGKPNKPFISPGKVGTRLEVQHLLERRSD